MLMIQGRRSNLKLGEWVGRHVEERAGTCGEPRQGESPKFQPGNKGRSVEGGPRVYKSRIMPTNSAPWPGWQYYKVPSTVTKKVLE